MSTVYPGGQVAQLVENLSHMQEGRDSSPRLAKYFLNKDSWLSGLFDVYFSKLYVLNVLVFDGYFCLHFEID